MFIFSDKNYIYNRRKAHQRGPCVCYLLGLKLPPVSNKVVERVYGMKTWLVGNEINIGRNSQYCNILLKAPLDVSVSKISLEAVVLVI